jgi:hypothetical protein
MVLILGPWVVSAEEKNKNIKYKIRVREGNKKRCKP